MGEKSSLFSSLMVEKAGNKSLVIFLKPDAELFEKSRVIEGLYAGHDKIGLYIEKKIAGGESYVTLIRWDSVVAVTNDVNRSD